MKARARVVAEGDGRGGTRFAVLRSEAPLVLRATPEAVYLVGGAGGPLGGDDLELDIEVGAGARLTLRTAAASIALPGRKADPSRVHIRASVGAGGELRWLPDPVVVARGCDHRMLVTVMLDGDALLVWREELILGRHGEDGGSVVAAVRLDLDRSPLVRQELALGPRHPPLDRAGGDRRRQGRGIGPSRRVAVARGDHDPHCANWRGAPPCRRRLAGGGARRPCLGVAEAARRRDAPASRRDVRRLAVPRRGHERGMLTLILIIVVLFLLFGGGGYAYRGRRRGL